MGLKLSISPGEKFIIGTAVVKNNGGKIELEIENDVPVIRGKDILSPKDVITPCQRIYYEIQVLYLGGGIADAYVQDYWEAVKPVVEAAPSLTMLIHEINTLVLAGKFYQALKTAKKLLAEEERLISNA